MTKAEARRLLRDVRRWGSVWWTAKDARFFFGPLEDAIRTLDVRDASLGDRKLVAAGYAGKGDVSDWTMSAPRAAARAYRAATRRDPDDAWSWQELAGVLADVGQYDAAGRALGKALSLKPAGDGVEWRSEEIRERGEPYFANSRIGSHPAPSWDVCELLARNRPGAALRLLRGRRDVFLRKLRARAYGILGETDRAAAEWEGIAASGAETEIEPGDWFSRVVMTTSRAPPSTTTELAYWCRALSTHLPGGTPVSENRPASSVSARLQNVVRPATDESRGRSSASTSTRVHGLPSFRTTRPSIVSPRRRCSSMPSAGASTATLAPSTKSQPPARSR